MADAGARLLLESVLGYNCPDVIQKFEENEIDKTALFMLEKDDLKEMAIKIGPMRKILHLIECKKRGIWLHHLTASVEDNLNHQTRSSKRSFVEERKNNKSTLLCEADSDGADSDLSQTKPKKLGRSHQARETEISRDITTEALLKTAKNTLKTVAVDSVHTGPLSDRKRQRIIGQCANLKDSCIANNDSSSDGATSSTNTSLSSGEQHVPCIVQSLRNLDNYKKNELNTKSVPLTEKNSSSDSNSDDTESDSITHVEKRVCAENNKSLSHKNAGTKTGSESVQTQESVGNNSLPAKTKRKRTRKRKRKGSIVNVQRDIPSNQEATVFNQLPPSWLMKPTSSAKHTYFGSDSEDWSQEAKLKDGQPADDITIRQSPVETSLSTGKKKKVPTATLR